MSSTDWEKQNPNQIIRTPDQRLRVFISSTLKELAPERQSAQTAINDLHLVPVLFELGARPHPPRNVYQAYVQQSHIFIGIYWQRYGWVAPDMDISGLEDEYLMAKEHPKLIYFKSPAPDREPALVEFIQRIKADGNVSYKYFSSAEELGGIIRDDLALIMTDYFEQAQMFSKTDKIPSISKHERTSNFPHPITPIIGREIELDKLNKQLKYPEVRLVTLTGPGGVGKTRLSLEIADHLSGQYKDGIIWVNLESTRKPEDFISSIAHALNVRERGAENLLDSIKNYLASKHILLLLDNFEQVVSAAPILVDILSTCPQVTALVTSRTPLRVRGEYEYPITPLAVPEENASHEELTETASVRLFVEFAKHIAPRFELDNANDTYLRQIVGKLDGLPLAIELAAARLKLFTLEQLHRRLTENFDLLSRANQDVPSRQQTIYSTINWSYELLNEQEQKLFKKLACFSGGFSLEAVKAVCNPDGTEDTLESLSSLLDNSLIYPVRTNLDQPRFTMLETIHSFAAAKLSAAENDQVHTQHANYFVGISRQAREKLFSKQGERWLDRLQADYQNYRSALEWLRTKPETQPASWKLLIDLTWLRYRRGYLNEARASFTSALSESEDHIDRCLRAFLQVEAGLVAMWQSDLNFAAQLFAQSLPIIRDCNQSAVLAEALFSYGVLAVNQGDGDRAETYLKEALGIYKKLGLDWFASIIQLHLGNVALGRESLAIAEEKYARSYALGKQMDDKWLMASAVNNFGELNRYQGKHTEAEEFYQQSQALFKEIDSYPDVARENHNLAWVALSKGECIEARRLFAKALAQHQQLGVRRGVVECMAGIGAAVGLEGEVELGTKILTCAQTQFRQLGVGIWPADNADYQRTYTKFREQIGEQTFNDAWETGAQWSLEQAQTMLPKMD